LPIVKPPYGVIAAIDVNQGKLLYQVPHGDTPDAIRNNPRLQGLNVPKTGQGGSVGIMVTKTMLVSGDPQITAPPGRQRGAMLRAYDKPTGNQIGEVLMPADQRLADDLQHRRPPVHHRRGRQQLPGRVIACVAKRTAPGDGT
jgi:quinoprotein glucose dehydrogenase